MELFHFSDRDDIARFVPRPVAVASPRPSGLEWLNGPLVWAIDDWHQPMYLFPRQAPRLIAWPVASTRAEDWAALAPDAGTRMIAWIEAGWAARMRTAVIHRYALPPESFEPVGTGMWVSRDMVVPDAVMTVTDLPGALADAGVALRPVPSLEPLLALYDTSLHVSGIRLRNMGADG